MPTHRKNQFLAAMKHAHFSPLPGLVALAALLCSQGNCAAQTTLASANWQESAAARAHLLSQVKWSPVAETMPNRRGGFFEKGKQYTGVPYSSVRSEGRYIGFDIALRTFLAAVENPRSVLYTENLTGKVANAAAYYGSVCSNYTSYALGCGIWEVSRRYGPPSSQGIVLVQPQSADGAQVGDVIYTPHATETSGSHVEMVTAVTRDNEGRVTSVRIEQRTAARRNSTHTWPRTISNSSASRTVMPGVVRTAQSRCSFRTMNSMPRRPPSIAPSCSISATGCRIKKAAP
jgi:hypothetical protein